MALHKDCPESPYAVLDPGVRRFPADEALRGSSMEKLPPPLLSEPRKRVKQGRYEHYASATGTKPCGQNYLRSQFPKFLVKLPRTDSEPRP